MKEIDQNNLDTAIALGDAVCEELGICCKTRGRVIFQIYQKLIDVRRKDDTLNKPNIPDTQTEQNAEPLIKDPPHI